MVHRSRFPGAGPTTGQTLRGWRPVQPAVQHGDRVMIAHGAPTRACGANADPVIIALAPNPTRSGGQESSSGHVARHSHHAHPDIDGPHRRPGSGAEARVLPLIPGQAHLAPPHPRRHRGSGCRSPGEDLRPVEASPDPLAPGAPPAAGTWGPTNQTIEDWRSIYRNTSLSTTDGSARGPSIPPG